MIYVPLMVIAIPEVMKRFYLITLMLFLTTSGIYGQGKLEQAEEDLKSEKRHESSNNENYDSDDNVFISTLGEVFINLAFYSFLAIFIESPGEFEHLASSASITKYPYYDSNKGNFSYAWDGSITASRFTISTRYIYENARIDGNHLKMEVSFLKRLGLEFDYLQLWENNPSFGDNSLAMYNFLAKYKRVRTEQFDAWWGVGGTYIDGSVNDWGFTFGLGAELFIANPISIESNFKQTNINSASTNNFNALLNYHIKRYKVSGGYEHLKIGNQKFSMMSLGFCVSF